MSHPMEGYWDGRRDERDRLWARRDALEAKLADISLSRFTVSQLADLFLLSDRSAPSEKSLDLEKALARLETWLDGYNS